MSAWDITGAIVWSCMSISLGYEYLQIARGKIEKPENAEWVWLIWIAISGGAVFCIARLLGAHT